MELKVALASLKASVCRCIMVGVGVVSAIWALPNSKERWAEKRENCAEENPLVDNGAQRPFYDPMWCTKVRFLTLGFFIFNCDI